MKKRIPGAEERAYLLANVEPTLVHERSPIESWEVWVLRDDRGEYRTRVCVSYGPTGSRIRRNTCRGVDTARIKIFKFGPNQYNVVASKATDEAWDVILGEDLEVAMSDVLNTEVKIIDLDNDPEHSNSPTGAGVRTSDSDVPHRGPDSKTMSVSGRPRRFFHVPP